MTGNTANFYVEADYPALGEVPDTFDDVFDQDQALAELDAIAPLGSLTSSGDWSAMDRWCAIVESDATRALVDARNEVASIQLRARIHLIREIRNLPDVTRARISRLRDALEEEYGDA